MTNDGFLPEASNDKMMKAIDVCLLYLDNLYM